MQLTYQFKYITFLLISVVLLSGCFTNYNAIKNQKQNKAVASKITELTTQIMPYNSSADSSTIYIHLNNEQLLYAKFDNEQELTAHIKVVSYRFTSIDNATIIDTLSNVFALPFSTYKNKQKIVLNYKLPATPNFETAYKISIVDINRKNESQHFVVLNKTNALNRQNFKLKSSINDVLFCYVKNDTMPINIAHNIGSKKLYVRYFKTNFPVALPPFSMTPNATYKFVPDSSFVISNTTVGVNLKLKKQGIYHLQPDSIKKDGLTLFKYHDEYPNVSNAMELVLPMRYILSKQEYEELLQATNTKEALDKVWLNMAGNANKGRELIRAYYTRVKYANDKFASYTEGWKTDRGMLYIVCGDPQTTYKNIEAETWIYGEENNFRALNFTFNKVSNPFTNADFELARNPLYKDYWYLAVDTWRSGKVFMNK
jgi:GWxTD domain-containing protein